MWSTCLHSMRSIKDDDGIIHFTSEVKVRIWVRKTTKEYVTLSSCCTMHALIYAMTFFTKDDNVCQMLLFYVVSQTYPASLLSTDLGHACTWILIRLTCGFDWLATWRYDCCLHWLAIRTLKPHIALSSVSWRLCQSPPHPHFPILRLQEEPSKARTLWAGSCVTITRS